MFPHDSTPCQNQIHGFFCVKPDSRMVETVQVHHKCVMTAIFPPDLVRASPEMKRSFSLYLGEAAWYCNISSRAGHSGI